MSQAQAGNLLRGAYHFFFSPYDIDNAVFKLHYRAAIIFLFVFCPLFSMEYVEESVVDCTSFGKDMDYTMNGYCFSVFTKRKDLPYVYNGESLSDNRIWRIRSYFFVISIFCLIPRLLWVEYGGRELKELLKSQGIHKGQLTQLVRRVARRMIFRENNKWYCELLIAELVNMLSVIAQWVLTYFFIDKKFFRIGPYISFKQLEMIFPTEFLCHYEMPGESDFQLFSICDLQIENWNQMLLASLYVWLAFLTILTALNLCYRGMFYLFKGKGWFCWYMGPNIREEDLEWMVAVTTSDFVILTHICEVIGKENSEQLVILLRQELGIASLELSEETEI